MKKNQFEYDVALSFAGEDRKYAEELANKLISSNIRVFYDLYEESRLWGENLYERLADIYSKKSKYCVIFISKHYANKLWTTHERRFAQVRAFYENQPYILPIKIDDTEIPSVPPTIGYVDIRTVSIDHIDNLILEKLKRKVKTELKKYKSPINEYIKFTINELKDDPIFKKYISLRYQSKDGKRLLIEEEIHTWLYDKSNNFMVILGDYGTGKTVLCKKLCFDLCEDFINGENKKIIPILINVRDIPFEEFPIKIKNISELIEVYCPSISSNIGNYLFLILLDGYDEMVKQDKDNRLMLLVSGLIETKNKVILTSRINFFKNEQETLTKLSSVIKKGTGLTDLELAQSKLNIKYLVEFDDNDVKKYLIKKFESQYADYYSKIINIYDLYDLSKRPILLDLISDILPKIDEKDVITQESIYGTTVRLWLEREIWRGIDQNSIFDFMKKLAINMFFKNLTEINFSDLTNEIQQEFKNKILSFIDLGSFDSLIRTSGFLSRDSNGNFFFNHRSFMEYFFAKIIEDKIREKSIILMREDGSFLYSRFSKFFDEEYKKESISALEKINKQYKSNFSEVYDLSDGIIELLESTLLHHHPENIVTKEIHNFINKRQEFREDERALHSIADRIRGYKKETEVESKIADRAFKRVTMIGGQGRIYYTVEHYHFNLLINEKI